jgi:diaminopimelate decarboxylase
VFDLTALRTLPADPRLVFEPGRYLAAPAGWYAAEVLDLKRVHGTWFAVLRGGTHHFRLPAAWGYSHPFTVLPVDDWPHRYPRPELRDTPVTVTGELCTPRDVLARDAAPPRIRAGDVVVFANAGAYGWDISHHEFLRHDPPERSWL